MSEKADSASRQETDSFRIGQPYSSKLRIPFLFILGAGISFLFFKLIWGFVVSLLMGAILAGLAQPVFRRLVALFHDHKGVASAVTVLLTLCLVVVPITILLTILANEAVEISKAAIELTNRDVLEQKIQESQTLQRLLPNQEEIVGKAGQVTSKAGTFLARGVATGAKVTAKYLLLLFVMLYAMFYFLMKCREGLDAALRFTPLTSDDKERLLATFISVSRATIKGTLVIGILQGSLAGLSFAVAGINGVVFWSAVMAVLSIVPGIGSALVWVPAVIFLALNNQMGAAVGVGLWCGIVVGTLDNVLRPILVGKDTRMPDLLVLVTTLGGLVMFGASGIVIGPVIGALFMTIWGLWGSAVEEIGETN